MEDGVYFNMPENEYHSLHRLSASGIKLLNITTEDFWARSWMNPLHEPYESDAMKMGSAYHKRILEGKDKFYDEYYVELEKPDFPEALITASDIKDKLKLLGEKCTGTKEDLIDRLLGVDADALVWDRLVEDHAIVNDGKICILQKNVNEIEYAAKFIEAHPNISKAFSGGYPEVTVLWTDEMTGVQMKARIDYLKIGATVDLKTFSNSQGKAIHTAIHHAFGYNRYHVQMAVYLEARKQARKLILESKVDDNFEFAEKLSKADEWKTMVVWQQTGIAPYTQAYVFEHNSMASIAGENVMRECMMKFRDNMEKYGTDPWISGFDIEVFEDEFLPRGAFE